MSQENVDATRAAYEESYAHGDFDPFLEAPTADFELITAPQMPDAGTYRGQEAREWLEAYINSFDGFTQEALDLIDGGDKVVGQVLQRGRPRGSDIPIESRWWQVITFGPNGVSKIAMFASRAEALDAAGLSE
jgi:ketosteroid isomerase-like protein